VYPPGNKLIPAALVKLPLNLDDQKIATGLPASSPAALFVTVAGSDKHPITMTASKPNAKGNRFTIPYLQIHRPMM
jgi:hypothetical protein